MRVTFCDLNQNRIEDYEAYNLAVPPIGAIVEFKSISVVGRVDRVWFDMNDRRIFVYLNTEFTNEVSANKTPAAKPSQRTRRFF